MILLFGKVKMRNSDTFYDLRCKVPLATKRNIITTKFISSYTNDLHDRKPWIIYKFLKLIVYVTPTLTNMPGNRAIILTNKTEPVSWTIEDRDIPEAIAGTIV